MTRVLTILAVAALAVSPGCTKKDKTEKQTKSGPGEVKTMGPATMAPAARRPTARRPTATRPVLPGMAVAGGMVVIPKGRNPLANVDISKGFGEGWFDPGTKSTPTPTPATPPSMGTPVIAPMTPEPLAPEAMTPEPMTPAPPPMAMTAAPMTPAPMTATPPPARPARPATPAGKPGPLPYVNYIHPDKSFGFRYPKGWHPSAQVRKQGDVPIIIVRVLRNKADDQQGELGAMAFIVPKAPPANEACKRLVSTLKKQVPGLETTPWKPFQKTGQYMFQATGNDKGRPYVAVGICGSAHGRLMFLSYISVGKTVATKAYAHQLGQALFTFTGDLLK